MVTTYRLWPDELAAPDTFDLAVTWERDPAPQGSKNAMPIWRNRHNGPPGDVIAVSLDGRKELVGLRMTESSKFVEPWRAKVQMEATRRRRGALPMDGPVVCSMVFTLKRPGSHFGTGRNAHRLKPGAPEYPTGYPDVSKLARAVEDALVQAGVLKDDARIWKYDVLAKVYPAASPPPGWSRAAYALQRPGVFIHLERS